MAIDDSPSSQTINTIASTLYGSFSLIYVSLKEQTAWSCTDRLSSRPLWHQKDENTSRLSSHAIAIARQTNEKSFSPSGLASYLLYATQVEPTHSLFPGISCQQEGTTIQYDLNHRQTTNKTQWYQFNHTPDLNRSTSSWIQLTADCFVSAAERLLKTTSNPLLFLSGGVDSRLAGAALIAAGGSPLFCTLGDSLNLEIKVAKSVARTLHCPQEIILRDDEWYLRTISRAMFSSNGTFSWNHSHFSTAYASLQDTHKVDTAILGDFCEAFSKICFSMPANRKVLWQENEFLSEFDELSLPNYRPGNRIRTLSLLKKDFREHADEALKESILTRFNRVSAVTNDPLIAGDYFFRWQTTSCIPTFQMFNDVRSVGPERNLMFDKELHQLLEIMPSSIRSTKNLGARIVHKLCPQAAWVPNANSLIPLHFPLPIHSFSKSIRPQLGKIRRKFFSNSYKTTASWPHLPLLYAGHPSWKKQIEERLFDNSLLPQEIFDPTAIEVCWKSFCEGDLTLHSDVERLFGLAELCCLL